MLARDTTRSARDVQCRVYHALGPARKVELAFEMSEQASALSIAGMLARDPALSPEEARARLRRRLLGDDLYEAAWGGHAKPRD